MAIKNKKNKANRVIYFIKGHLPSNEAFEIASELEKNGFDVVFRNLKFISTDDKPEECNYVAGDDIPHNYARIPNLGGSDKEIESVESTTTKQAAAKATPNPFSANGSGIHGASN